MGCASECTCHLAAAAAAAFFVHPCKHASDDNAQAENISADTRTLVPWDNYDPVHPIPAEGLVP
jgi:hypothetical protein